MRNAYNVIAIFRSGEQRVSKKVPVKNLEEKFRGTKFGGKKLGERNLGEKKLGKNFLGKKIAGKIFLRKKIWG